MRELWINENPLIRETLSGDPARLAATTSEEMQSLQIFRASGYAVHSRHYLLYEVAARGHVRMVRTLVEVFGFSTTILEDSRAERRREQQRREAHDARATGSRIIHDDASRWMDTGDAYYCGNLSEFVQEKLTEAYRTLPDTVAPWAHHTIALADAAAFGGHGSEQRMDLESRHQALRHTLDTRLELIFGLSQILAYLKKRAKVPH